MSTGLIHVYTGDGKGKTTAAVGLAIRAKSRGLKVLFAQFMKDGDVYGEIEVLKRVGVEVITFEKVLSPIFHPDADRKEIRKEALRAVDALKTGFLEFDLAILDEFNCVLAEKLITLNEAFLLIKGKPADLELVLTGRGAPEAIIDVADLVTEMKDIKHPFQEGISGARPGIDY